jgi:cysteine synthase A
MLPDTGERYLSTPLFDDIPADMTAAEIEIANSTPGYRFGAPPPPPAKEEDQEDELLDAPEVAVQFVNDVTSNADDPVVMFSHEWCEFCWSVRKMFAKYEVPYRSIDLDSVEYQLDNKGGEIRAALRERTTSKTIPQIFIGGQYIGGATDLFDACKDGSIRMHSCRAGSTSAKFRPFGRWPLLQLHLRRNTCRASPRRRQVCVRPLLQP